MTGKPHNTRWNIGYWNINGAKKKDKIDIVYELMKDYDIVLLAETHTTKDDEHDFAQRWGRQYRMHWAHGTSQKNGMCMAIKQAHRLKDYDVTADEHGRWVALKTPRDTLTSAATLLLGVYAPSKPQERQRWMPTLNQWEAWDGETIAIGDWNCTANPSLDRISRFRPAGKEAGTEQLQAWMTNLDLRDAYRHRYPHVKAEDGAWTFRRGESLSRIDRILLSGGLIDVDNGMYGNTVDSDHRLVWMTIDGGQRKRRDQRLWRMHNTLPNAPAFRNTILKLLDAHTEALPDNGSYVTAMQATMDKVKTEAKRIQRQQGKKEAQKKRKRASELTALQTIIGKCSQWAASPPGSHRIGLLTRNLRWAHRKLSTKTTKKVQAKMSKVVEWAEDTGAGMKTTWTAARWADVTERINARHNRVEFARQVMIRLQDVVGEANARLTQLGTREWRYAWARVKEKKLQDRVEEVLKTGGATRDFFQRAEKRRAAKPTTITSLHDSKGNAQDGEKAKQKIAVDFYEKLWGKRPTNKIAQRKLLRAIRRKLNNAQTQKLNEPISQREVSKAIKMCRRGAAPGIDGIPIEFYKSFSKELAPLMANVYNEMILQGRMPDSVATAVVVLFYKKNDKKDLKNYRPISLLTAEYKILAKIMAERLKTCLPTLVHPNQQGFVQGGDIRGNILLQKLTAQFCAERLLPLDGAREGLNADDTTAEDGTISRGGIAIFYDGEKAYDRQDRDFMCQVLEQMGCGKDGIFMKTIRTMYTDTKATIRMSGELSDIFDCKGGVRQGCPLSCYLYILVVETLAEIVRQDEQIRGISLPRQGGSAATVKIALFADDTTGYVQDWDSVYAFRECMTTFERASGARVNVDKTFVIVMGTRWTPAQVEGHMNKLGYMMLGADASEKYLGELITTTGNDSGDYRKVLAKARGTLLAWRRLRMYTHSRVRIANALILLKFLYRASVAGMGKKTIEDMQDMLKRFVWMIPLGPTGKGKRAKVSLQRARRAWTKGGIELRDVALMTKASRCSAIKTLRKKGKGGVVPAWGEWLHRDLRTRLKGARLEPKELWERSVVRKRQRNPWSEANYTESCASVWWQLRSRTAAGMQWAAERQDTLHRQLQLTDNEMSRRKIAGKLSKLAEAYMDLKQGDAFFCARPRQIVNITDMTAKQIYWTLVEIEDKTKPGIDDVRTDTGEFVREKRLCKVTMTDDEKDLWFLFRNGQLRLGHALSWMRHGQGQWAQSGRRLGKCCMCAAGDDIWSHVLICEVRRRWMREWLHEAKIQDYKSDFDLRQAMTLEARAMKTLHLEIFSKMWCAWVDMWKAWKGRRLRSKRQMKRFWKRRWHKRLKRAIYVDRRTNEKKARKKWKEIIDIDPNQPSSWNLIFSNRLSNDAVSSQEDEIELT